MTRVTCFDVLYIHQKEPVLRSHVFEFEGSFTALRRILNFAKLRKQTLDHFESDGMLRELSAAALGSKS